MEYFERLDKNEATKIVASYTPNFKRKKLREWKKELENKDGVKTIIDEINKKSKKT